MHTHNVNVKTATRKTPERCSKKLRRIIDKAHSNVACAEEAHLHYGEKFTRFDVCNYFIRGAFAQLNKAFKESE
ncbi:hypothetical protein [Rahnella selenatireducens]|uniref:hypothetical protein n=1 Tax=Rahnella selenatireducens TaxID=3389797 RepID=UPI00396810FC